MLDLVIIVLTVAMVFVCAAGLIKAGKVPKMPAFYQRMIKEGIFNKLIFKNYDFRKTMHDGRHFPEAKIEEICGLYNGIQKETE